MILFLLLRTAHFTRLISVWSIVNTMTVHLQGFCENVFALRMSALPVTQRNYDSPHTQYIYFVTLEKLYGTVPKIRAFRWKKTIFSYAFFSILSSIIVVQASCSSYNRVPTVFVSQGCIFSWIHISLRSCACRYRYTAASFIQNPWWISRLMRWRWPSTWLPAISCIWCVFFINF